MRLCNGLETEAWQCFGLGTQFASQAETTISVLAFTPVLRSVRFCYDAPKHT